jgi:hypothetical protein
MCLLEKDATERRDEALALAKRFGGVQESHHQAWLLDQMCRVLLGDEYPQWVAEFEAGEDGAQTYQWQTGIAP